MGEDSCSKGGEFEFEVFEEQKRFLGKNFFALDLVEPGLFNLLFMLVQDVHDVTNPKCG